MPSWLEARAALTGFGRLLRFDPGFVQWFDRSQSGALRSFRLMLPLLPCFVINIYVAIAAGPPVDSLRLVGASAVIYLLGWILFPLSLIVIGRALGREAQAIGTITFYNWNGAIFSVIQTMVSLLGAAGLPSDATSVISNVIYFAMLLLEGFAFRILLGIGVGGTFLLVVVDYFVTKGLIQVWLTLLLDRSFF